MPDNLEIKLDQLTQAIKGLYAKSSTSQNDMYNALAGLFQRYESLNNISAERILTTLVAEFRKTIDDKYGQTNEYIRNLDTSLRGLITSGQGQNPKMASEVTKLLNDTASAYSKLAAQEEMVKKILLAVEKQQAATGAEELSKLSDNFLVFSSNFDGITENLNKNFAEFLSQIRQVNTKDDLILINAELSKIANEMGLVTSCVTSIEDRYHELQEIINSIKNSDLSSSSSNNSIYETITRIAESLNSLKEEVKNNYIKDEFQNFKEEIKNSINSIQSEIKNGINNDTSALQNNVFEAKNEIKAINDNLENFKADFERLEAGIKEPLGQILLSVDDETVAKTLKELSDNMRDISMEVQSALYNIQTNMNEISGNNRDYVQNFVNISQDIQTISPLIAEKIENIKAEIQNENENSISIIKESFSQTALLIEKLQDDMSVLQNSTTNITLEEIQKYSQDIQQSTKDAKQTSIEIKQTSQDIHLSAQALQQHLQHSSQNINELINKIQSELKVFTSKETNTIEDLHDKMQGVVASLSNISIDGILSKVQEAINTENKISKSFLEEVKTDVSQIILDGERTNKTNLVQLEQKLDKLIESFEGPSLDNAPKRKPIADTVVEIIDYVEKANLQQIHNSKELLEEVQASNSDLSQKLDLLSGENLLHDFKDEITHDLENFKEKLQEQKQVVLDAISEKACITNEEMNIALFDVIEKLKEAQKEASDSSARIATQEITNQIEKFGEGGSVLVSQIQEHTEKKLLESVNQLSQIIDDKTQEQKKILQLQVDVEEFSAKLKEYISNFEFQKENIVQEIKETMNDKFAKIELDIKRVHSNEDNPNYNYTLEDAESDMSKIQLMLEKHVATSVEAKGIQEKIAELKNHIVENSKLNHDIESELGNYSGWMKDLIKKIDDVYQKLDSAQGAGMDEINSRLVQSEKSRINSAEFNAKMENGLKSIYKNIKNQGEQIDQLARKVEFLAQTQNENFNPSQFIDIFYDNMTQTKMLSNRVEIMEDKINLIQESVEKLLNYVEQG